MKKRIACVDLIGISAFAYCIIVTFFLSYRQERISNVAKLWGELIYSICISIVAAYVFYYFQVFIRDNQRKKHIYPIISHRIDRILNNIDKAIFELGNLYLTDHRGNDFSGEELHTMMVKLNYNDATHYKDVACLPNEARISVRRWLIFCAQNVEDDINRLYQGFGADLPVDISAVLEKILYSSYHREIIYWAKNSNTFVIFDQCSDEVIFMYWTLRKELESVKSRVL
ncbi:MAG: hypothetical protein IKO16_09245 [Lachnospiraceae bacterium]|nr:hypothetical protein [Lachnospiraceae bacterium]